MKNKKTVTVMVLSTLGKAWLQEVPGNDAYDALSESIAGDLERVLIDGGLAIFCNEEGKLLGLPRNQLACDVFVKLKGAVNMDPRELLQFSCGYGLVGPCILFRYNRKGGMESLTTEDIKRVTEPKDNGDKEMSWEGFQLSEPVTISEDH